MSTQEEVYQIIKKRQNPVTYQEISTLLGEGYANTRRKVLVLWKYGLLTRTTEVPYRYWTKK